MSALPQPEQPTSHAAPTAPAAKDERPLSLVDDQVAEKGEQLTADPEGWRVARLDRVESNQVLVVGQGGGATRFCCLTDRLRGGAREPGRWSASAAWWSRASPRC